MGNDNQNLRLTITAGERDRRSALRRIGSYWQLQYYAGTPCINLGGTGIGSGRREFCTGGRYDQELLTGVLLFECDAKDLQMQRPRFCNVNREGVVAVKKCP